MNRFIYYYSVFDIVVNQTKGELYWRSLHCLACLKMGCGKEGNGAKDGSKSSATQHLVKPADYPADSYHKGTAGTYNGSRQKLADSRYIGSE